MKHDKKFKEAHRLAQRHVVTHGRKFSLADHDPGDTGPLTHEGKHTAKESLQEGVGLLAELQDTLYAEDRWSLLLIFQAMDAAGKDSVIKHVMSGVNPQGCQVTSFKAPSPEEIDHDFLWRCVRHLPERGRIGIFNRSYYEEVLVVQVHPEILDSQKLPAKLITAEIWQHRYEDMRAFERHLSRNGVCIRKFFLHVSRKEQRKRFLERLDTPEKNWKFSVADLGERKHWKEYMAAYEEMIRQTATEAAPWYVVPADNKWYTRLVVASAVVDALASLGLHYPELDKRQKQDLAEARRMLE